MKTSNDDKSTYTFALFMFGIAFCLFVGLIVYGLIAVNHPGNDPVLIIKFYEDAAFGSYDSYKKVEKISNKNIERLERVGFYPRYQVLRKIAQAREYIDKGDDCSSRPRREEYYEKALSLLDSLSRDEKSYYGGTSKICTRFFTGINFDSYKQRRDNEFASKANAIVDGVVTKPYLGMSDSEISSTELGDFTSKEESREQVYDESFTRRIYYWKDSRGNTIFKAISKDGKVITIIDDISKYKKVESNAASAKSSGNKAGSTSPSSGSSKKKAKNSITDGYYAAEDFYEDYYDDFCDFDEAEEYYYEHGGF